MDSDLSFDWEDDFDQAKVEGVLQNNQEKLIQLRNIPNARTAEDFDFQQFIRNSDGEKYIQEYKCSESTIRQSVDPDSFRILGDKNGFRTYVRIQSNGLDNLLEVNFIPKTPKFQNTLPIFGNNLEASESVSFVREPYNNEKELDTTKIRKHLSDALPNFMIPTYYVQLSEFPLSQNGKVLKPQLPIPNPTLHKSQVNDLSTYEFNPKEQVIAEIWSKSLGVDKIGPDDDFFELGGHSLLAVKVMSQIDTKLGVRIPIATLFHYPTIASLAQKLSEEDKPKEWSCIVPIKTTGSKKPLFIVHGAGLNVMPFHSLANVIDGDQPIYGIQSKGLNGIDQPFDSIKEMADFYVNQLLEVQPKGNIELAGYSFGGVVAFEMARILKEKHQIELEKVIMIEAYADQVKLYENSLSKFLSKTKVFWEKRFFNFKILLESPKIYKEEKLHYYSQNIVNLTNSILGIKKNAIEDSLMQTIKTIEVFNKEAMKKYMLAPFDIKIALLKTKNQYHWLEDFDTYGWKGYAREVVSEEIRGNHNMIFEPENIQILATGLERILKK